MKPKPHKKKFQMLELIELRALLIIIWRQGIKRKTRFRFWSQVLSIIKHNPRVCVPYIAICAHLEHFIEYRQIVRDEIEGQVAEFLAIKVEKESQINELKIVRMNTSLSA